MTLSSGAHLGPYEIVSAIGVGGMGEVYRARDTKLGRDVAIKVLPAEFTSNPERRARFDREARVLAALNHPHIAVIHGAEEIDGVQALVLELVEGETLQQRLIRGSLPIPEALRYAISIAEALDAAHQKGIIHRDLKPSNIKLTPGGILKVLDFGLAKVVGNGFAGDAADSATLTIEATRPAIVGSAAYMSPEQARGEPLDKRTDIWAFGCVVFEMLSGRRAFARPTISDTIVGILDREPDWDALPSGTPRIVRRLLHRCLEKDAALRLRDIGDAIFDIRDALVPSTAVAVRERPARARLPVVWLVSSLLVAFSVAAAAVWSTRATPTRALEPMRFSIVPPPMLNPLAVSVSPDGRLVAFPGALPDGRRMLFVRPMDSLDARPLPGTEGTAVTPFWSPDSRSVAFQADRKLKTVNVDGGTPTVVADFAGLSGFYFGGSWNSDALIIFGFGGNLYRVPAAGGVPTELRRSGSGIDDRADYPQFLPDGRHYLYLSTDRRSLDRAIFVGSVDSTRVSRLLQSDSKAMYVPPHFLLFTRQRRLLAQRFDASTRTLAGDPMLIADAVMYRDVIGNAAFAASNTGTLIYRTGGTETGQQSLIWIDRTGRTQGPLDVTINSEWIRLSPDGKRIAFPEPRAGGSQDIWIYDLERNFKAPLTSNPAIDHLPVWSPDSLRVAFGSARDTGKEDVLYERRADGATPEQLVLTPEPGKTYGVLDWTSEYLLFSTGKDRAEDIWALPLTRDRKPFPYLTGIGPTNAAISPNGRWLAYVAHEGGTSRLVVRSFPDPTKSRQQVSSNGGAFPLWRRDGRELFYLNANWRMIAVPVGPDGAVDVGKSSELFTAPGYPVGPRTLGYTYGVSPDGQRFLFTALPGVLDSSAPITVVVNWPALLRTTMNKRAGG